MNKIIIKGARAHNLKNISLNIPRNKIVVITGVSGSGKSSLVFDTIYAESQKKYLECLSSYTRQLNNSLPNPDIDEIEGLSPSISLKQKLSLQSSRSTIGTISEISNHLRLLFAKIGFAICPQHKTILRSYNAKEITEWAFSLNIGTKIIILAPLNINNVESAITTLQKQGYLRLRINKQITEIEKIQNIGKELLSNTIELVVDRLTIKDENKNRLISSIETALKIGSGHIILETIHDNKEFFFSNIIECQICKYQIKTIEPSLFSHNSNIGACKTCKGTGNIKYIDPTLLINPELSLINGAINIFDKGLITELENLAHKYNFDSKSIFKELPKKIQSIIIWGENIYNNHCEENIFSGVINCLEKFIEKNNICSTKLKDYCNIKECPECKGSKICIEARNIKIKSCVSKESETILSIDEVESLKISECIKWVKTIKYNNSDKKIVKQIIPSIINKLSFLEGSGLGYLSLNRNINKTSRGEAQRIMLSGLICSNLTGITYVLDEPSAGLHKKDMVYIIKILEKLRELGNSIIIVEHDETIIKKADWIIEIGPGAGIDGGEIIAEGKLEDIINNQKSITGYFLKENRFAKYEINNNINKFTSWIQIETINNSKKAMEIKIPHGYITCITGISGSGKSNLVNNILLPAFLKNTNNRNDIFYYKNFKFSGINNFNRIIYVDQNNIGTISNSNIATYCDFLTNIRELFAQTTEARVRGYKPSRFSFNIKGGRCEECNGNGIKKIDMYFLPNMQLKCNDCNGTRYNHETLDITYKNLNIAEILELTVEKAMDIFKALPNIAKKLQSIIEVGLSYICIGQSLATLSGGELQRLKIATELAKKSNDPTLYVLDEPTLGLHFKDIDILLNILYKLLDKGDTILIVEHNLDIIKNSHWIIDLESDHDSDTGTKIINQGTPKKISLSKKGYTAEYLL
ncbi:excinuclease ABC subunit UvrA [Candidatus Kinetoplastidibacterium crithidiae]|uniref:UvrABC system protein A n=1 Tax=Candidatus Kinetoplastidibacterium crithidiae TCC036E TaxID=1208918 RepID=M1M7B9_9PROT|nr:excinuclease ABC subunit UvrA [Candidatus Kinetoplastibacterium crithidii]AFZ82975.1 excinuclease ABC subunit A [Candidatus Kinetoplastibacterium crithidii (ex Angomonas deanei ATCC 30255)]AGF47975.1 excinuclease ABC subunit A uvrA [Candidatus Kinetoplastibacterium crithidii TCC036E]